MSAHSSARLSVLAACLVAAAMVITAGADTSGIVSDDFNACDLNTALWQVLDPLGGATVSMTGIATEDAIVSVSVPAGQPHHPWLNGDDTVRLMQPANDTDLQVTAKFETPSLNDDQIQGVIAEQDASNYLVFDLRGEAGQLHIRAAVIAPITNVLNEDFEIYADGDEPAGWVDTDAGNSMAVDDTLFKVVDTGDTKALGTSSTLTDIHTHYVSADSNTWANYEFTGRMMMTTADAGIGVTFLSDYPNSDSYYRLRRFGTGAFHISPHPWPTASITGGTTDSGVVPVPDQWYRFRIRVEDDGAQTLIQAKVWADGDTEPGNWQIDCYDANEIRYTTGTVGTWSYNTGSKYWDDLNVTFLQPQQQATVIADTIIPAGAPLFMSVARTGQTWTQQYSYDGATWSAGASFDWPLTLNQIGFFAGTGTSAPAFTSTVDYFFNDASPIDPEDGTPSGNPGTTLTVNVTGSGNVTWDPAQSIYYCNEQVTLTAQPDAGWLFDQWAGDVSATDPMLIVTMDQSLTIEAVFVPDNRPIEITNVVTDANYKTALITWTTNKPTTEQVAYGLTTGYELGTEAHGDYRTDHTIQLTGLTPLTEYHFQITCVDLQSNSQSSADMTFSTTSAGGFLSDDFNTCTLDAGIWQVVDLIGDADITVSGIGTSDARVAITLPEGTPHDTASGDETVRITQPADNTDFEIEAKFDSLVTADGQFQGIVVSQDADHFIHFDLAQIAGQTHVRATTYSVQASAITETFENYATGSDPASWLDTDANSSMTPNDSLFKVFSVGGSQVFGTISADADIHSHYVGQDSSTWTNYEYIGRMMISTSNTSIGVTFFSDYPNSDTYYRLRRTNNSTFHIAPHPDGSVTISGGVTDTGVMPSANTWYRFRIQVQDTGSQTDIRAKVWQDGTTEPANWQVDCYDDHPNRITSGTVGLWSIGSGSKYWDDLQFGVTDMSSATVKLDTVVAGGATTYLAITRSGDQWTQEYSTDGSNWTPIGSFTLPITVNTVGASAGNTGAAPAFTSLIDYFFNRTSPIVPEDGIPTGPTPSTLTVNVTGNGTVTIDPEQSVYYCNEQVTLTATPDLGYLFDGWSGDLAATEPVQTITMSQSYNITATFIPDDRPVEISNITITPGNTSAVVTWDTNKPTQGQVAYGTTTAYELGTVSEAAYDTSHSVLIEGLQPLTDYHCRITSTDPLGHTADSADVPFTTQASGGFESDDFNACALDTQRWQPVDPIGDASFTVSGIGTDDAVLTIDIPGGTAHRIATGNQVRQPARRGHADARHHH